MPLIPVYNPSLVTIPPFSAVRIEGEPIQRGQRIAWPIVQVGAHADDADPSRLAFVGALPIGPKGYGSVSQIYPARVQVAESVLIGERTGPRPTDWKFDASGEFVSCGGDVSAKPAGSLAWVSSASTTLPTWCQGWLPSVIYPGLTNIVLNRDYPIRFRLQQPPQLDEEGVPIDHRDVTERYPFEPIDDGEDHGLLDYEKTFPKYREVGWIKVREAGRYLVHFQGIVYGGNWSPLTEYIDDTWWYGTTVVGVGLFARKPKGVGWEEIEQPAVLASRNSRTKLYMEADSGTVMGPNDITVDESYTLKENVAASAVIELGADWAFGLVPIHQTSRVFLANWGITCAKIGASHDPDHYWEAVAEKIDPDTGWFIDPAA